MKKTYAAKLKSYSAYAAAFFASANAADAQVVYTDISPDQTFNTDGASYDLDLNNDGTFDFQFRQIITPGATTSSSSSPGYNKVEVEALNSNMIAGSTSGAYIYPLAMAAGDSVKPSLQWNVGAYQSMGSLWSGTATYGNWPGSTDKYIGLKINVSGATYYGWARLDVNALATQFTIKDYAYMNAPDQPIMTGSTSVGIRHDGFGNVKIYNDNRTVYITNPDAAPGSLIQVYDISGKEIITLQVSEKESILQMENEKAGAYFVRYSNDKFKYTKKIIIN
ncbi:MAG TPA: T9SS type A sorting domain-containing protein [Bacteroidia bacterium]|jgi:hypothetical protein